MVCNSDGDGSSINATSTADEQQQQQKQKEWEKLKKCIHCSMVAFGSDTMPLYKLANAFRSEWSKYGDLLQCAVEYGFTGSCPEEAVLSMLQAMPESLECQVQGGQHGKPPIIMVRVATKEQTKDVVKVIDVSNQHKTEMKMQRAEQHRRRTASAIGRFGSSSSSSYSRAVSSSIGVPQNPNLIPLGPRRRSILTITASPPSDGTGSSSPSSDDTGSSNIEGQSSSVARPFSNSAAPLFSFSVNGPADNNNITNCFVPIPDAIAKLNGILPVCGRQGTNNNNNKENNSAKQQQDHQRQRAEFAKRTSTTLGWSDEYGRRLGLPISAATNKATIDNNPTNSSQQIQQQRQQYQKWYNQSQQPQQQSQPQQLRPCPADPVKKEVSPVMPNGREQIAETMMKLMMGEQPQKAQLEKPVIDTHRVPPLVPRQQQNRDNTVGGSLQGTTDEEGPSPPKTASSDNDTAERIAGPSEMTDIPAVVAAVEAKSCAKCAMLSNGQVDAGIDVDQQWVFDYHEMMAQFARLTISLVGK